MKSRGLTVMLKSLLLHPLTRGLDIDDPHTTALRKRIIKEKSFLRKIYEEWYKELIAALPQDLGPILEIGSGAGFLKDLLPRLITSEIFYCDNVGIVLDACQLPFANNSLRSIVMTNVLHHMPHCQKFFMEASRCLRSGGVIAMIEPWVTPWSRLAYTKLHHEPFFPERPGWDFSSNGPLSGANSALPWIIFQRDRRHFEREFPMWQVRSIKLIMPFRYLVSGGVSLRSFMPGWSFGPWRSLENILSPWMKTFAMFAEIILVKVTT